MCFCHQTVPRPLSPTCHLLWDSLHFCNASTQTWKEGVSLNVHRLEQSSEQCLGEVACTHSPNSYLPRCLKFDLLWQEHLCKRDELSLAHSGLGWGGGAKADQSLVSFPRGQDTGRLFALEAERGLVRACFTSPEEAKPVIVLFQTQFPDLPGNICRLCYATEL